MGSPFKPPGRATRWGGLALLVIAVGLIAAFAPVLSCPLCSSLPYPGFVANNIYKDSFTEAAQEGSPYLCPRCKNQRRVTYFDRCFRCTVRTQYRDIRVTRGSHAPSQSPDRPLDSLAAVLETIWKEQGTSYHSLLRNTTQAIVACCQGEEWSEIATSLKKQGISLVLEENHHVYTTYRYRAKKEAYRSPSGIPFSLFMVFDVRNPDPGRTKTALLVAKGQLSAEPRMHVATMLATPYPAGTVLDLFFAHPEVKSVTRKFPLLQECSVGYHLIRDRWVEFHPWGFHLLARFSNSDNTAGKSVSFTIPSGLDPPESLSGQSKLGGFTPIDVLGQFHCWGSSDW